MHGSAPSFSKLSTIRAQVAAETERLVKLARTVGKRLRLHLHRTADTQSLPDETWAETSRWYSRVVVELNRFLADQPDAANEKRTLSQAEYEAELREITIEELRGMTPAERRELLQKIEHEPEPESPMTPASLSPVNSRWDT